MTAPEVDRRSSDALRAMARRVTAARHHVTKETCEVIAAQSEALRALYAERDRAEHARHKAWLRTGFGRWFARHAYTLGLITGQSWTTSATCSGCVKLYWRGKRPYILGARREWWSCLLRYRHLYAPLYDGWLCAKCAPCPTCQSADPRHDALVCEETAGGAS